MNNITIKDSLYFTFNHIRSKDCKLLNISLDGGMQQEYFAAGQSINKITIKDRHKPYFQNVKKDVLTLTVDFAFEDNWTEDELRSVRRWLTEPTYYAPLIFSSNPEKIYYALYIDRPELYHNSMSQGYLTITFECNDAYAYSPLILSPLYEWDKNDYAKTMTTFQSGEKQSIVTDSNGHLIINTQRVRWSDFPQGTKLIDLQ